MISALASLAMLSAGSYVSTMRDGSKVTLVSVSDAPRRYSWTPDGDASKPMSLDLGFPVFTPHKGDLAFFMRIEVQNVPPPPKTRHLEWQPSIETIQDPDPNMKPVDYGIHVSPDKFGPNKWVAIRYSHVDPTASTISISAKIADSAWKTIDSIRFRFGMSITPASNPFIGDCTDVPGLGPRISGVRGFPLNIPPIALKDDWRVVGYDNRRNEIFASSIRAHSKTYQVFEGPKSDLAEVELQTRPFEVVRFTNIRTRAGKGS